jgi:hypothetical protein
MADNFIREAIKLHREGWTAIDFGLNAGFNILKLDKLTDSRNWGETNKRTWLALQALDKDESKPV